jgi:hypothetical protein
MTLKQIKPPIAGWLGHAKQADSAGLCAVILSEVYFTQGDTVNRSSGGSGRVLEQQSTEPPLG